jgi:hypothetical protein
MLHLICTFWKERLSHSEQHFQNLVIGSLSRVFLALPDCRAPTLSSPIALGCTQFSLQLLNYSREEALHLKLSSGAIFMSSFMGTV